MASDRLMSTLGADGSTVGSPRQISSNAAYPFNARPLDQEPKAQTFVFRVRTSKLRASKNNASAAVELPSSSAMSGFLRIEENHLQARPTSSGSFLFAEATAVPGVVPSRPSSGCIFAHRYLTVSRDASP